VKNRICASDAAGLSGRYFADAKETKPGDAALDDAVADRLSTVTEHLVARATSPVLAPASAQ
jgi:hypothetical protein